MKKVSVIIPVFNREILVIRAIKSCLAQAINEDDLEIIVVDDGSLDGTATAVKNLGKNNITYVYQENAGVSSARNNGIANATGKYIAFLDSDDILRSWSLLYRVRFLDDNPNYDGISGSVQRVDNEFKISENNTSSVKNIDKFNTRYQLSIVDNVDEQYKLFRKYVDISNGSIPYVCSSLMVRRTIFNSLEGFNTDLKNSEDLEFFNRLTKNHLIKYDYLKPFALIQYQDDGESRKLKRNEIKNYHQDALNNLDK